VQHVIGLVVELQHLSLCELLVAAQEDGILLLRAVRLVCARLHRLCSLLLIVGLADPAFLLLVLVLEGVFKLLVRGELIVFDFLLELGLGLFQFDLLGGSTVLLVFYYLGVAFQLLVLSAPHC
jgi:hypothetical protein